MLKQSHERMQWVPVRSESELRVGMTVRVPVEGFSLGHVVVMLLEFTKTAVFRCRANHELAAWKVTPPREKMYLTCLACLRGAIAANQVFRLETGLDLSEANPYLETKPKGFV